MKLENCNEQQNGCVNCLKKRFSLFNNLSNKELELLNSRRKRKYYKKGSVIFNAGDDAIKLHCLNSGAVKIYAEDDDGNTQLIELKKEVDFLGFHELISEKEHNTSAIALNDVSICSINKDDFFSVINQNQDFSFKIINNLSESLRSSERRMVQLTQKQMRARIATSLLEIASIFGYDKNDKQLINLQLKRKELASFSNMTTANAIRTLASFKKEGIITTEKRKIRIINPAELLAIQQRN
jgi:CRP-like cAMP-binding protein